MPSSTAYAEFHRCMSRLADLDAALSLLNWDQEIMMPKGAGQRRAGQLATLAELRHQMFVNEVPPLLAALENATGLDETQQLNVACTRADLAKQSRLPAELVAELTRAASEGQFAWENAKDNDDFAAFAPFLERIVELKRRQADCYGYDSTPYDALLDDYERGLTVAQLDVYFDALEDELRQLLIEVQQGQAPEAAFLRQVIDEDTQWKFTLEVLALLGFDPHHGRQDRSAHPFSTSIGMEDVRITTRLEADHLLDAVYSTIHEFGHALYERNLPPDAYGLPQGQAHSLALHESQSRFWENEVGRSLAFVQWIEPRLRACFPDGLAGHSTEDIFRALNRVEASLIRTQADELTYHLHIILRYRLEKDLIEGRLAVRQLPEAWNAGMEQLLGVVPRDNRSGVLQDVHWSIGALGYFPTYSLGSLYAAQWRAQLESELGSLADLISTKRLAEVRKWLAERIHSQGSLHTADELCRRVTGRSLDPGLFISALCSKLQAVYGFRSSHSAA
jgi:carboxypeptidase Taq